MAAGPDQQRLKPEERANLVAYLDGELTEAESRELSTKITHSATARREVESLRKTWEALDKLPRPHVTGQFHERTLTYIRSIEGRPSTWADPVANSLITVIKIGASLLITAAACAAGYLGTLALWPNPDARTIRELSLAEHLEEYLEVGDFQVLDGLRQTPEFGRYQTGQGASTP